MIRHSIGCAALLMAGAWGCAEVAVEEPASRRVDGSPSVPAVLAPSSPPAAAPIVAGVNGSPSMGVGLAPASPAPAAGTAGVSAPPRPVAAPPAPVMMPLAPPAPSGELLLSDDFEDGDAAGWIADADDGDDLLGNWAVVEAEGGRVYAQLDDSFDDESWSVGGNLAWTDVRLDARYRFTAVSDVEDAVVMLALRFQNKDNYYFVEFRGDGSVKLRKRVDGSDPELESVELDRVAVLGEWVDVSVTAQGSSLEVSMNGQVVATGVMDSDLASGGIALGVKENAAVEFDDVRVTAP